MVLPARIELATPSLPRTCSTTELRQRTRRARRPRFPATVRPLRSGRAGCVFPVPGGPGRGRPTRGRELHEVPRDGKSGCPPSRARSAQLNKKRGKYKEATGQKNGAARGAPPRSASCNYLGVSVGSRGQAEAPPRLPPSRSTGAAPATAPGPLVGGEPQRPLRRPNARGEPRERCAPIRVRSGRRSIGRGPAPGREPRQTWHQGHPPSHPPFGSPAI